MPNGSPDLIPLGEVLRRVDALRRLIHALRANLRPPGAASLAVPPEQPAPRIPPAAAPPSCPPP